MFISKCKHDFKIIEISNVLQQDDMGYPLRLVIVKCSRCGETEHQWIDVDESALDELKSGKSVLLKWKKV